MAIKPISSAGPLSLAKAAKRRAPTLTGAQVATLEGRRPALERLIRRGALPEHPALVDELFALDSAHRGCPVPAQRARLIRQFELLFETIADTQVAGHWRELCLDQIFRPAYALQRLADDETSRREAKALFTRLLTQASCLRITHSDSRDVL